MSRLHFDQDIQPLSDCRAGTASFIRQVVSDINIY